MKYLILHIGDPKASNGILNSGLAVCSGYSNLFEDLCKTLNIECKTICGYAKGYSFRPGERFCETNHEWNCVLIDDRWRLVDSTWGAGIVSSDKKFKKEFDPFYFLTPPQIFIYEHYPQDDYFRPTYIDLEAFSKMQKLKHHYFVANVHCLTHDLTKDVCIKQNDNSFKMEFSCDNSYELSARIETLNGETIENVLVTQRNPFNLNTEMYISLPANQHLLLLLFLRENTQDKPQYAGEILLKCSSQSESTLLATLYTLNTWVYLISPLEYKLRLGETRMFKVYFLNAIDVALIDAKKRFVYFKQLDGYEHIWYIEYTLNCVGKLGLAGRLPNSDNYEFSHEFFVVKELT